MKSEDGDGEKTVLVGRLLNAGKNPYFFLPIAKILSALISKSYVSNSFGRNSI